MNINKLQFPWKPVDVQLGTISENACIGDCYQYAKFHACIKKCNICLKFRAMPPDYIVPYSPKGGIGLNTTKVGTLLIKNKLTFTVIRIQLIRKSIALITIVNQESLSFFETLSGYIFLLF